TGTVSCSYSASASAGLSLAIAGVASISNTSFPPPTFSVSISSSASAALSELDVVLSGPSGQSTTTFLNLTFEGIAAGSPQTAGFGTASVDIGAQMTGPGGTVSDAGHLEATDQTGLPIGSGLLFGWTQLMTPLLVDTSPLQVQAGDVVRVGL